VLDTPEPAQDGRHAAPVGDHAATGGRLFSHRHAHPEEYLPMAETGLLPMPAAGYWMWAPERGGFGGYAGTCTVGPFTFTVSASQRFGANASWELRARVTLAGVTTAKHSWEADTLSCTPDGILTEIAARDVLNQLAENSRRWVVKGAQLLHEFDGISRAYPSQDDAS
jgi:hypothetical protein